MPIAYTVQDPFHWENYSKSAMNEPSRRNSLLSDRRNSLLTAMSAFEFSMFPPPMSHRSEHEDIDPFAPLSIEDELHSKSMLKQSAFQSPYDRVLTDRSESSGDSTPSLQSSTAHSSQSIDPFSTLSGSQQQGNGMFNFHDDLPGQGFDDSPFEAFSAPAPTALSSSFSSRSDDSVLDDAEGDGDDSADSQRFKRFHEEKWSHRYKELLAFHREFGHSAVPHTFPRNPQLARWVKRQRRQYKLRRDGRPSTMTVERLQLLDSVGFVWDSHDVNWREKLMALDNFRHEHGHCNVPSNYTDKKLATWVKCQRRQYKLHVDQKPSAMTEQRITELEKRGFEWEIRSTAGKTKTAVPDYAPCSY